MLQVATDQAIGQLMNRGDDAGDERASRFA